MQRVDHETGLLTRDSFLEHLSALHQSVQQGNLSGFHIFAIDLEPLFNARSTLSPADIRWLLTSLSQRLADYFPETAVIGRTLAEITAVIPEHDPSRLGRFAEDLIHRLNEPYTTPDGRVFDLILKAYILEYPGSLGLDCDIADIARFHTSFIQIAKSEPSVQQIHVFTSQSKELIAQYYDIDQHLMNAVNKNEFFVVYQPRVNLVTGEMSGAEALLRWHSDDLGMVPPNVFIPRAENIGVIHQITPWVIKQVCRDMGKMKSSGPEFRVGINLSPSCISGGYVPDCLAQVTKAENIDPDRIELEITESQLVSRTDVVIAQLEHFRDVGSRTALDDFGTGYSTLATLTDIPLDIMKIDREFIRRLPGKERDVRFTKSINDMGKALGLTVIAEGIETAEQARCLVNDVGVHLGQGFYYGKPMPLEEFNRFEVPAH